MTPARLKPLFSRARGAFDYRRTCLGDTLVAQIKDYKPDILLNQAMDGIGGQFLKEVKPYVRLLVGQHASPPLSQVEDFGCYDLVISSFLPTVERFRLQGIPAELNRLGFEPRVLSFLKEEAKSFDVTFVGSYGGVHRSRTAFLESLCVQFQQMKVWGPGAEALDSASPLRRCYVGQAWGHEMYQILKNSKITLNHHHGDVPHYANNMRLFEATGVGALLVTDWKDNLCEMFELGKELVAYRTPGECAELIRHYLKHDEERNTIAHAGQQRTLREHTYEKRVRELAEIVHKYL
jgi:hypothetical protein